MKKQYTKKQITEAIAYWKKQLKTINESEDAKAKFAECASTMLNLILNNEVPSYYLPRGRDLEQFKNILMPIAGESSNNENAAKFMANSKFKTYINGILSHITSPAMHINTPEEWTDFYFTTDAHGNKVVVVCRLKDNTYLAVCNGDKYETPEFYYTFYRGNGDCINGNRDETWLDIYSIDKPRTMSLQAMNLPNDYIDYSMSETDKILSDAGFKKYNG